MDFSMIPSIVQGAIGAGQMIGGALKLGGRRPEYEISEGLRTSVALAKARTMSDMPGFDDQRADINLATANAIAAMRESGNPQAGFQGAIGAANTATRRLGSDNARYKDAAMVDLQRANEALGRAQDLEFQMNEFAPYAEDQQEGRDMIGGGSENIMQALKDYFLYKETM